MSAFVEVDEKGRILLPIGLRRRLRARKFKVTAKGTKIELEPVADVRELKGKYREVIASEWEELEERGEELVSAGRG